MWPAGLRVDNAKLFVYDKMLIPETHPDRVFQECHNRQLLQEKIEMAIGERIPCRKIRIPKWE